jgi:hypothetical protein
MVQALIFKMVEAKCMHLEWSRELTFMPYALIHQKQTNEKLTFMQKSQISKQNNF